MNFSTLLQISGQPISMSDGARRVLASLGIHAHACVNLPSALDRIQAGQCGDVVLADVTRSTAQEILSSIASLSSHTPVIVALEDRDMDMAAGILAAGAADAIRRPIDPAELAAALQRVASMRRLSDRIERARRESALQLDELVGKSEHIRHTHAAIAHLALSSDSVLIAGEAGTGKNLIAASIHSRSPRAPGVCMRVDCSALRATQFEQEIFGGAGLDGRGCRAGALELSHGGTLILARIDQMPVDMQERLADAIDTKAIARGGHAILTDVRIVCTTTEDLRPRANAGRFSARLLEHLSKARIGALPLRERPEDAEPIGEYFYRRFCSEFGAPSARLGELWDSAGTYTWPGNARELKSCMERAALLAAASRPVSAAALGIAALAPAQATATMTFAVGQSLAAMELEAIRRTVELTRGNRTRAAKILGISVRSLYSKLREIENQRQIAEAPSPAAVSNSDALMSA